VTLSVSVTTRSIPPVPDFRLIEISGTGDLPEEDFAAIATLPGAFFLWRGTEPIPIRGSIVASVKSETGLYPDPVFVSAVHRSLVEELLSRRIFLPPQPAASVLPRPTGTDLAGNPYALFDFQDEAARRFVEEERMLLLLPGGSGKTLPAFAAAEYLREVGAIDRTVIVSPRRGMTLVWAPFARAYYGRDSVVIEGPPKRRSRLWPLALASRYTVMKYETFKAPDLPPELFDPRTLVIIDEVHHVKNERTDRFAAVRKALDAGPNGPVRYRLYLTGSVVYDKPLDIYGPISLLGLRVWANRDEFLDRYFTEEKIATGQKDRFGGVVFVEGPGEIKGEKEAAELRGILDAVSYRKTAEEIGFVLPPLRREEILVTATPAEENAYLRIVEEPLGEILAEKNLPPRDRRVLAILAMERDFSSEPSLIVRSGSDSAEIALLQVGGPEALSVLSPGSKARALIGFLGELLGEDLSTKVVVFTPFDGFLQQFAGWTRDPDSFDFDAEEKETLRILATSTAYFSGSLSDREGDAAIRSFLGDPGIRVLLSTDAGSEQLNLQGLATRIVHYDDPLSLGSFDQRLWRVWRRGADRPVVETRFALSVSEGLLSYLDSEVNGHQFVDERLKALLAWKKSQRAALLGPQGA